AGPVGVYLDNATVELDGTNDEVVKVNLKANSTIGFFAFQGTWTPNLDNPSNYFTLDAITSDHFVFGGVNKASVKDGEVAWDDPNFICYVFNAGENILTATYKVAADTPAGTYEVTFRTQEGMTDDWMEFGIETYTATITVVRPSACDHKDTTSNYNKIDNADKHTVTVTCDDCGETIGDVTEEACDTNGAKCVQWTCDKCDASYAANTEHNYENPEHKCVCGDVETYTLTIKDWHTESITFAAFEVPYGAKLVDYLASIEIDDIYVNDESAKGVYEFTGDWMFIINEEGEIDFITSESTMIADDFTVFAYFSFSGWMLYYGESVDYWCYLIEDGALVGWNEIDGEWYYFDTDTGARAEGLTRVPYPTDKINGNTYAPNQEDIDYSASKDRVFIDKEKAWFLFGEDGKFQSTKTGIVDGIYALNGMIVWHPGVVEFEGNYYYFIGDLENGGNKLAEGDTWVTRNNTDADFVIGGCYNFVNGKLSGINGVINGKYYQNSRLMLGKGLVKLDDGYIYVRSNGDVVVDRDYWVAKTNGYSIVNGIYTFDENGYIVDPIDPTVYDGIVEV
ncbi:MAG: hypothetical protein IKU10_01485, partial [Clostridia bacterium]|nr:hypothetical protein [Clostridia bacterium]